MNFEVINELLGKTFSEVARSLDAITFYLADGTGGVRMLHNQDCCESVWIESVVGDLDCLVGVPLVMAEVATIGAADELDAESATATFYKFATIKGSVDIRWNGTSNGCYSERVSIEPFTY